MVAVESNRRRRNGVAMTVTDTTEKPAPPAVQVLDDVFDLPTGARTGGTGRKSRWTDALDLAVKDAKGDPTTDPPTPGKFGVRRVQITDANDDGTANAEPARRQLSHGASDRGWSIRTSIVKEGAEPKSEGEDTYLYWKLAPKTEKGATVDGSGPAPTATEPPATTSDTSTAGGSAAPTAGKAAGTTKKAAAK
jgi:hypothetical protein